MGDDSDVYQIDWQIGPPTTCVKSVEKMEIRHVVGEGSKDMCFISLQSRQNITIMKGLKLKEIYSNGVSVVQTSMKKLIIYSSENSSGEIVNKAQNLKSSLNIKGVALSDKGDQLAVWDDKQIECYEKLTNMTWTRCHQYVSDVKQLLFCGDYLVEMFDYTLIIRKSEIVVSKVLFKKKEGKPLFVNCQKKFLVAISENYLKIWEMLTPECNPVVPGRSFKNIS
eukprot:UN29336